MARILITSGPTRQYLDPVRYLSNASSGKMGAALAKAAIERKHEVVIVSGPVGIDYPAGAKIINVVSTNDMLTAAVEEFKTCDGVIAAAAPCDYRAVTVETHKIKKTGAAITVEFEQADDVLATLGNTKIKEQWSVGFALETQNGQSRAFAKLKQKRCDLIILNNASAIEADVSSIQMIDAAGSVIMDVSGSKSDLGVRIIDKIGAKLLP